MVNIEKFEQSQSFVLSQISLPDNNNHFAVHDIAIAMPVSKATAPNEDWCLHEMPVPNTGLER